MSKHDSLGVFVRALGLLFLASAALMAINLIARIFGISVSGRMSKTGDLWALVGYTILGLAVIRRADRIVSFAYPDDEPSIDTSN